MNKRIVFNCTGFDWDEGNSDKNWFRHKVLKFENEEVFFNQPLIIAAEKKYSQKENRYYVLDRTDAWRRLFMAFTIRKDKIPVISAREMNEKERRKYDKKI